MSLLAGFDLVIEISNPALTRLLKRIQFTGLPLLNPPFELTLPFTNGDLHLIINDLQLDLEGDDSVNLSLVFSQSSVIPKNSPLKVVCPLSGTLTINARLRLDPRNGTARQVVLAMSDARARISYTPAAEQTIAAALSNSGVAAGQFKTLLEQEVNRYARAIPDIGLPLVYDVVPGRDGDISPALRFSSLQVHCLGHSDRNRQALCLYGNLLAATQNNGNHFDKTATAIAPGQDMATSISPGAFRALIFCPAVRDALAEYTGNPSLNVRDLPTDCGASGGLDVNDLTLTAIRCAFLPGAIGLFGSMTGSGTCYEASGFFTGTVTLAVSEDGHALVPTVKMDEPQIGVTLDWYCFFATSFVLADITSFVLAFADEMISRMVKEAKESLKAALGNNFMTTAGPAAIVGTTFSSVSITPEGLSLQGRVPIFARPSDFFPSLSLEGSVTMLEKKEASTGVWRTRIFCQQEEKDYPYVEYAQRQVAVYAPKVQLLAIPISAKYAVRAQSGPSIPLSDVAPTGSNTVAIPNVECTYPMPLGTGGTKVTQTVHLGYTVKGTDVRLRNRPEEGNFGITLEVSVLDCSGAPPPGIKATEGKWIAFQGSTVEMGGEYLQDYQRCMNILEGFNKRYLQGRSVPVWVKVDHPPEWQIFAQIRALKQMQVRGELGARQLEEILLHTRIAHGESFTRAYHSPSSLQLGAEPEINEEAIALETVRAELTAQITNLTELLAEIERPAMLADQMKRFVKRRG